MLKYSHPELYVFVQHWPIMIFLPCILVLITILAFVTKWWDQRDAGRAEEVSHRANMGENQG